MSNLNDFVINNGVLEKYTGNGGDVVIPDGVVVIGKAAFQNTEITSVVIPSSVRKIEEYAFYDCCSLKGVEIPEGVETIGKSAFWVYPSSLEYIKFPKSLKSVGKSVLGMSFKSLKTLVNLSDVFLLNKNYVDCYGISLREVSLVNGFMPNEKLDDIKGILKDVAVAIYLSSPEEYPKNKQFEYDEYITKNGSSLIKKLIEANNSSAIKGLLNKKLLSKAAAKKALTLVDENSVYFGMFEQYQAEQETKKVVKKAEKKGNLPDEFEYLKAIFNEKELDKVITKYKGDKKEFENVLLKNGEKAHPFVVKCAVVPYLMQYKGRPKAISEYKTEYVVINFDKKADKVAELLEAVTLRKALENLYKKGDSAWLFPYCRHADKAQITALISDMNKWKNWEKYGSKGRSDIMIARGGLMLSDTREAMMAIEKVGKLSYYAKRRNTDEDTIRNEVMSEFGLDKDGKKEYDLGNKKVIVSMSQELSLTIYDVSENKYVKSLPKRGADEILYLKAQEDFNDIKKNAKKVVKSKTDEIFSYFLSGKHIDANKWINTYTKNSLMKSIASLVVWYQSGKTFILDNNKIIDSVGNEYQLDKKNQISVAHPKDMKKADISAWQKYFTTKGLKQPFEQIWEPAVDFTSIKEDRYKDIMIPFYRFRNSEKHGITVEDVDFHNEINIYFADCNSYVERIDYGRHSINNEDRFEIKSFKVKRQSRVANHIVVYFDKITVAERILKDDISIATYLDSFTLAQITEFINTAADNKCNNCLALLLEYKNNKYFDYDPMDAFVLE